MSDPNNSPGPGGGGPAGPEQEYTDNAPGAMDHVRAAWQMPGGKLLAAVPAVVALIVGGALGTTLGGGGGSKNTAAVTSPGQTDTVTVTGSEPATGPSSSLSGTSPATPTGTGTGTGPGSQTSTSPSTNPTQIGVVPLVDLTPASGAWQSRNANPLLNGTLQQFSIIQDIPELNSNGDVGYNLGRDYTKFTGLIGLDDNSPKSTLHPTIEIDGDGLKIAAFTPTLGHPAQINLDVTGVLRLDIKYTSLEADGSDNTGGQLILGNGQLTTVPGYHPPAPSSS